MSNHLKNALDKANKITDSNLSIYNKIPECEKINLWLSDEELDAILNSKLVNFSLHGFPNRTASKEVKTKICKILGYPVPSSFKKTKPRFIGQNFDTYNQKSDNLQVWNEPLDPERRYLLIRRDSNDIITKVKVVRGKELAKLDTTGTLTQKYQASTGDVEKQHELVSEKDTSYITKLHGNKEVSLETTNPVSVPSKGQLLSIETIYEKLKTIVGNKFINPGSDQERNRGAELHKLVCTALGFSTYQDNGQFPDIRHQLLEVKLQTSPTIDLGLVTPDSKDLLDISATSNIKVRHCDVRYAIFCAKIEGDMVVITNLILTNGEDFFSRLPKFGGKVVNKKIQIPLPKDFFD